MKVAIVGSRDYPRLELVRMAVKHLTPEDTVISGGARGVDSEAAAAAKRNGIPLIVFLADWEKYGKRAGFLRNTQIVEACDVVMAFWDGKSRGTMDTVTKARAAGKPVYLYGTGPASEAILYAPEAGVPGMGTPYPATERDEDSEYEYAREDAPLLQEDRR